MNSGYIKIAVDQTMAPTIQAAIDVFEVKTKPSLNRYIPQNGKPLTC